MKLNIIFFPLGLLISVLPSSLIASSDLTSPDVIAEGGRLYDKWWTEYEIHKPRSTHPSYPSKGKKSGANTWRCKECHGWDYKGATGAYAKGSHYTGIKGITNAKEKSVSEIVQILKNKTHLYNQVMYDYGLIRIANFVKHGQLNISSYVNNKSKRVNGNIKVGKTIFNDSCKECHGSDGREENFKTKDNPEYVGTIAAKNPWETMHKIRNGHPGAFVMGDPMPNMNGKLSIKEQIDLLSYLQTLPIK